ncbi:hypothetical protein ASPSYDRAFT_302409 [Aspergillus sydowii CBS 593.65]|uniref:Uncharacterized protein n=1 Tax=Aspergillus sydowii CBS 593.65 TaxID=1036612 RepID=A0A1L9TY12_9EURO|nr:uncharacterized protein ASPSYDRAFT_302409 [Aspergillus sydowii CBS 593.65]OJJ64327.1 hypothetical protein ASPSYDRAFT_302409 [Aspergillus sydowii CBS 593.65]
MTSSKRQGRDRKRNERPNELDLLPKAQRRACISAYPWRRQMNRLIRPVCSQQDMEIFGRLKSSPASIISTMALWMLEDKSPFSHRSRHQTIIPLITQER